MSTVQVSVVVPVYNPATAIEECIESLLRQTSPWVRSRSSLSTTGRPTTHQCVSLLWRSGTERLGHHDPELSLPRPTAERWVAATHGEYVQFVDQDDHLATQTSRTSGLRLVLGRRPPRTPQAAAVCGARAHADADVRPRTGHGSATDVRGRPCG